MSPFFKRLGGNEHLILSVVAVLVGLLVGYGAILFRLLIELFQIVFMGDGNEAVVAIVQALPWWHVLLMPALGGLLVGLFVHFVVPGSRGHGVPEVIVSVALHGGKMRLRDGLGKMVACSLSIGCGGSVGREGPVIHLGATLASALGSTLHMSTRQMRTMVGCGAAAGIAASFNAPIAGVMFALEVILADYGLATFSPIVLSSVTATVVARAHLGDFPAFIVPHYTLVSVWEIPAYVGLGLLCGLTGILFMFTVFKWEGLMAKIAMPRYLKPILGGLGLGAIALLFPQVMGVGYDTMNQALLGEMDGMVLLVLVLVKILATAITLGSGFSGGVFTPSLFLGAMVGGSFGTYIHALFPALSAGAGAYALVGMGAMSASVLGAPIASILILFELTSDYRIMLPLMVSSIIATLLISQLYRDSIYTRALRLRHITLPSGREAGLLSKIPVTTVMRRNYAQVVETMSVRQFREKLSTSKDDHYLIVDPEGTLRGVVSCQEVRSIVLEENQEDSLLIRDIAIQKLVTVTPDHTLYDAFRLMGLHNVVQLPVVATHNPQEVVGMITGHDIVRAYNKALVEWEAGSI